MNANSEKIVGIVQHLANLTFIFDVHEKLGTEKSPLLLWEWQQAEEALEKAIKEKQDARKSGQDERDINKTGADHARDQSRRSIPDRRDPS